MLGRFRKLKTVCPPSVCAESLEESNKENIKTRISIKHESRQNQVSDASCQMSGGRLKRESLFAAGSNHHGDTKSLCVTP